MKKYLIFLILAVPIVLFQNCERMSFTNLQVIENGSLKSDNNGTGYGGKLAGEFYRFNPQFTCENKEAPVSALFATSTAIVYSENKALQCGAINETIDTGSL